MNLKISTIIKLILITLIIYCFISIFNESFAYNIITYSGVINANRYPGYKDYLDTLKNTYGFDVKMYVTGIDWNEAVTMEYQGHKHTPTSLFDDSDSNKGGMWYCPICGNSRFDSGIACASKEAIEYMLDPRNSLDIASVYQFMNIEGNLITVDQIRTIVSSVSYLNNDECISALYDAQNETNLSAAFLVAKIRIELGANPVSALVNGTGYNGQYAGYYNFYNFNATGNGTSAIILNALSFAKDKGWNSKRAAIIGGAQRIKSSFIDIGGQNTFYFLKFNTAGKNTLGSMQYEQNIMGAELKGRYLRNYCEMINSFKPTLLVPLYENMPATKCTRPDINTISSLTYEEGVIQNISTTISLRSKPSTSGLNIISLKKGENIKIIERAKEKSSDGNYWDIIVAPDGSYGYICRSVNGDLCVKGLGVYHLIKGDGTDQIVDGPNDPVIDDGKQMIPTSDGLFHMTPDVLVEDVKAKYPTAVVKATNGNIMTSGVIGTFSKIELNGTTYTVVKRGDIDGDGRATVLDVIMLMNHVKEYEKITNSIRLQASRISNSNCITIIDVVYLLNVVKGIEKIHL